MDGPPLANDLEWLLQSGQAGSKLLAAALIDEFYQSLHRLAAVLLNDQAAADYVAVRAFVVALGETYRYRSQDGVRAWLYRLAIPLLARTQRQLRWERLFRQARPAARRQTPDDPSYRAFLKLPFPTRLAATLAWIEEWSPPELAQLLDRQPAELERRLARAQQTIEPDALRAGAARAWPEAALTGEARAAVLQAVLQDGASRRSGRLRRSRLGEGILALALGLTAAGLVWGLASTDPGPPAPQIARTLVYVTATARPLAKLGVEAPAETQPTAIPTLLTAFYILQPGDTLESVAADLGVDPQRLAALNRNRVEDLRAAGQPLRAQLDPARLAQPTASPRFAQHSAAQPLDQNADSLAIYLFLSASSTYWDRVWADGLYNDFGPPGYIGQPFHSRSQLWVQPEQARVLSGSPGGERLVGALTANRLTYLFYPPDYISILRGPPPLTFSVFRDSVFPAQAEWLNAGGTFIPIREERQANRWAVVVDWRDPAGVRLRRLWIDKERGLILRLQRFDDRQGELLLTETILNQVSYDYIYAPELFDPAEPWPQAFAADYRGAAATPETQPAPTPAPAPPARQRALDYPAAPVDFDPAGARLDFVYPPANDADDQQVVRLIADGYELSTLTLSSPWSVTCARSPDGAKLAFSANLLESNPRGAPAARLFWLDLYQPGQTRLITSVTWSSLPVFSPDSRYLAYFAAYSGGGSGVFIFDTLSGANSLLLTIRSVSELAWSAEMQSLIIVGQMQPETYERLQVRLSDGKVLGRAPANAPPTLAERLASPGGLRFELPGGESGLGNCIEPR